MKSKVWQEVKGYSKEELEHRLQEAQEHIFRSKFRHSSSPLKNPLEIRALRRDIARYKTLLKQKSLPQKSQKA